MTALVTLASNTPSADAPPPPRVVFDLTLVPWWPYVLVLMAWFVYHALRGRPATYWRVVWTMVGLAAVWALVLGYFLPAIRKS